MVKEKLIHWRNVHSPLLYDLARHIDGPPKYWDIKQNDEGSPLNRALEVLHSKGLAKADYRVIVLENEESLGEWSSELESGEWDLSLRAEGFGLLINKEVTERRNLVLGGRLRFFNS